MTTPPKTPVTLEALQRVTKTTTKKHDKIPPKSVVSRLDAGYQKEQARANKKRP
jgi:hypothetical protein